MPQGSEAPPHHIPEEVISAEPQAANHLQAADTHHQEQADLEFLSDYSR